MAANASVQTMPSLSSSLSGVCVGIALFVIPLHAIRQGASFHSRALAIPGVGVGVGVGVQCSCGLSHDCMYMYWTCGVRVDVSGFGGLDGIAAIVLCIARAVREQGVPLRLEMDSSRDRGELISQCSRQSAVDVNGSAKVPGHATTPTLALRSQFREHRGKPDFAAK